MTSYSICPDTRCGGRVEPITNGNGSLVDRCVKCSRTPQGVRTALGIERAKSSTPPASAAAAAAAPIPGSPGRACTVKGCPGRLDAAGVCSCCTKRQAFLESKIPKKHCEICEGSITGGGNRRFCDPCKPIATKVKIATAKAGAR